jgi:hypothetical protein
VLKRNNKNQMKIVYFFFSLERCVERNAEKCIFMSAAYTVIYSTASTHIDHT